MKQVMKLIVPVIILYASLCCAFNTHSSRRGTNSRHPGLASLPTTPTDGGGRGDRSRRGWARGGGGGGGAFNGFVAKHPTQVAFVPGEGAHEQYTVWGHSQANHRGSRPREIAGAMGIGSLLGALSGFSGKKFGQALAIGAGMVLVSMKVAEELGYVTVHWEKIDESAHRFSESLYEHGTEGRFRQKVSHMANVWRSPESKSTVGMLGSFATGFAFGLRHG